MIALLVLACGATTLTANAVAGSGSNAAVIVTAADPAPAYVMVHWRNPDHTIGAAQMTRANECSFSAELPNGVFDYWVVAVGDDGSLVATVGSEEAPRDTGLVEHWCDQCGCMEDGGCRLPELSIERIPPPPPPRRFRIELAGGITADADPVGTLALGGFIARGTELRAAARVAKVAPAALAEVRQFLRGRRGLAIDLAAGGWHDALAGGGAAYVLDVSHRAAATLAATALVDTHGAVTVDAQAGVSISW